MNKLILLLILSTPVKSDIIQIDTNDYYCKLSSQLVYNIQKMRQTGMTKEQILYIISDKDIINSLDPIFKIPLSMDATKIEILQYEVCMNNGTSI